MASDPGLRIAYPVSWWRPDTRASCEQVVYTIAALARLGHAVTVLAPTPRGAQPMTARALADFFALEPDFAVQPIASPWSGDSLISGLGWLRQLARSGRLGEFDMLLTRLPAVVAFGLSAPLPFAFDHYRPWPDIYPVARPMIRRAGTAPACLGIVVHSAHAAESYRRIGIPAERIIVAHNGGDGSRAALRAGRSEARAALGLDPAAQIALYAGRVNRMKGLDQVLAMARLRPHVRFVIVGSEGEGPIEAQARAVPNVVVVAWQEPTSLPAYFAAADVLLIPPSSEPLRRYGNCVLPLKTFGYLAAGRAILAPALPDTAELFAGTEAALLVEPDDPQLAAAALDSLLGDPVLAARLGANARALSERNSWDARAQKLQALFRRRLGEIREASAASSGFAAAPAPSGGY